MIEKFLNKEEKKIFSKKNLKKIQKNDFKAYLEMEETILESLKKSYQPSDLYNNYMIESRIEKQEDYVEALKHYYETIILKDENPVIDDLDDEILDFDKMIKEFDKIQK